MFQNNTQNYITNSNHFSFLFRTMASYNKTTFGNIDPKCPKHSTQMPSALSSTILDYYHKYGRNRDLEKYLRFRNRTSSGSSSIQLSPAEECRAGKSLENINILETSLEPEKGARKSKSSESLNQSGRHSKTEGSMETSAKCPTADNQIKLTSKKAVKSKKKYNINMDTCIEITLPQQLPHPSHQQQQTLTAFDPLNQHDFSQQKIELETSETQTERNDFSKTTNRSDNDASDMPRPSSVASSAASISNKQRLEWDSMADVGYYKSTESSRLTHLTEFERKALKKFFASHGVNFDDELVMFASKSKLSASVPELAKQAETTGIREKWDVAFRKILEEKYAKRSGKNREVKVDRKQLWHSALVKFREKYGKNFNPETDLCITEPAVHSTPISADPSTGAISKVRSKTLDTKSQTDDVVEKERIEHAEKGCQTSMVVTSSKECQVDETTSDVCSALDLQGISSSDNSKESEKSVDCKEGLISAASFEFVAAGLYRGQDKENIPPCSKEIDKANAGRREDNKENVPPRVPDNDEIADKFQLSTPRNTTTESSQADEIFGVISTLENDLTRGVDVLYSLANSNELNEAKKKKLVRQIIKRITNAKYKDSTASSESLVSSSCYDSGKSKLVVGHPSSKPNISGVNTLSSTSSSSNKKLSSAEENSSLKQNNSNENSIKDWLKPITNSEVEHERKKTNESKVGERSVDAKSERQRIKNSFHSDESRCDSDVLKFVEKQRQSQFEWIDKEIGHLVTLKEYLQKKRETDIMKDIIDLEMNRKASSVASTHRSKESGIIYENIQPRNGRINYAEVKTQRISVEGKALSRLNSKESAVKESTQKANEKDKTSDASSSMEWNSHINMQQFVRNRKKLQTPNEDIASYARSKEQEFVGKYECIRSRPIYTQPYSSDHSDHYSEPRDNDRKTSSKKNINAYTSITGSDGFLSSDSVSIAVANSTSNNTTTHQYDTQASVAIQTSNSLTRTAPVFKAPSCNCATTCHCVNARRPTIRVKYQTNDKQLQVIPQAICYDIRFDEKKMKSASVDDRMKSENNLPLSDSSSTSSKDVRKKSEQNFVGNFGGCAKLSLQDHLKSARPGFVSQADERRKCVIELHNLR